MMMPRVVRLGCLVLFFSCSLGWSAAQNKTHVERPIVPARAGNVSTVEGIVKASYETISGGVGVPRDWGRDRTLFDPNSRSVAVSVVNFSLLRRF